MPFIHYILLVYKEQPVINKHQTSLLSKDYLGDLFFNIIKPYSSDPGVWVTSIRKWGI